MRIGDLLGSSGETLLDEDVYSDDDLDSDRRKLQKQRRELDQRLTDLQSEYKELIRKGANADGIRRKTLAKKAEMVKKRFKMNKKQYQKNGVVMATLVTVEAARDLMQMSGKDTTELETVIAERDVDPVTMEQNLQDRMEEFDLNMHEMEQAQDVLDLDVLSFDMETGTTEEERMMEEHAADGIDDEKLELGDEDVASDEMDDLDDDLEVEDDIEVEVDLDDEELDFA